MAKATTFCSDILALFLNATPIANLADNASSGPLSALYVSLHNTNPGVGGSQLTGETAYTNYVRVSITRNNGAPGWTVTTGSAVNISAITFAQCGVTPATINYVAIGTASGGAGKVLWVGSLTSPVVVQSPYIPQFLASALTVSES